MSQSANSDVILSSFFQSQKSEVNFIERVINRSNENIAVGGNIQYKIPIPANSALDFESAMHTFKLTPSGATAGNILKDFIIPYQTANLIFDGTIVESVTQLVLTHQITKYLISKDQYDSEGYMNLGAHLTESTRKQDFTIPLGYIFGTFNNAFLPGRAVKEITIEFTYVNSFDQIMDQTTTAGTVIVGISNQSVVYRTIALPVDMQKIVNELVVKGLYKIKSLQKQSNILTLNVTGGTVPDILSNRMAMVGMLCAPEVVGISDDTSSYSFQNGESTKTISNIQFEIDGVDYPSKSQNLSVNQGYNYSSTKQLFDSLMPLTNHQFGSCGCFTAYNSTDCFFGILLDNNLYNNTLDARECQRINLKYTWTTAPSAATTALIIGYYIKIITISDAGVSTQA
ncbi:MAG: hypothetical protein GQ557_01335 [Mycoplasmataceae bacterium]|nr:hypothetical protein [Mycoplasmataceae bacterium]